MESVHKEHPISEKIKTLTPREREVIYLILTGSTNKEVADTFEVSQRTIEVHRAAVIKKLINRKGPASTIILMYELILELDGIGENGFAAIFKI